MHALCRPAAIRLLIGSLAAAPAALVLLLVAPFPTDVLGQPAPPGSTIGIPPLIIVEPPFQRDPGGGGFPPAPPILSPAPPSAPVAVTTTTLLPGCTNLTPTVTELVADFAARTIPSDALNAIWEQIPSTLGFRGFSPLPGAPSDLTQITRLQPVFVCVDGDAALTQPAI